MRSVRNLELAAALAGLAASASLNTSPLPFREPARYSKPADLGELVKVRRAKNKAAKKARAKNRSR